jgi:hypothetical protein
MSRRIQLRHVAEIAFALLTALSRPAFSSNDVGIIPAAPGLCPAGSEYITIYMDDEDDDNASSLSGWTGAFHHRITDHVNGTELGFCRVSGSQFFNLGHAALINLEGQPLDPAKAEIWQYGYSLLKLGDECPNGSKEHVREIDNENQNNLNESSGNIAPNTFSGSNTFLFFCLFTPTSGPSMNAFPDLGIEYAVFAGRHPDYTGPGTGHHNFWIQRGVAHTDDEDNSNDNSTVAAGFTNDDFFAAGATVTIGDDENTDFFIARVGPCHLSIAVQPQDTPILSQAPVVLTVTPSGNPPYTYQWRRNGVPLSEGGHVHGSKTAVLTIDPATLDDAGKYDVVVESTCRATAVSTQARVGLRGLVAYWPFDLPSLGQDRSGFGHTGQVGATSTNGNCDDALHFLPDNNVQEFSTPDQPDLDVTGEMTGLAWIRPRGEHSTDGHPGCTEGTIFAKGGNNWFQIEKNNDQFVFQNEGSGNDVLRIDVDFPVDAWTHVAFVRAADGRTVRFFKDGDFVGSGTLANFSLSNPSPLMIGNYGFLDDPGKCEFNGDIDEVYIYDRALEDGEVRSHFENACGPVYSPMVPAVPGWAIVALLLGILGVPAVSSRARGSSRES